MRDDSAQIECDLRNKSVDILHIRVIPCSNLGHTAILTSFLCSFSVTLGECWDST